jgi:hypothetical protein
MSAAKPPTAEELKAIDLANYREFRRLRAENPFQAAELLTHVGGASLERGRELDTTDSEPPNNAA